VEAWRDAGSRNLHGKFGFRREFGMKKVLVAGATGYLGRFVVKAFKAKGCWVRALGRSEAKLAPIKELADELFIGEVTDPGSLDGLCDGIDAVFSQESPDPC
jgi:uncharacterized protein YbjT (DUF2867 family)